MTEDSIERQVERTMDMLDRLFMQNKLSQDEYDQRVKRLDHWAKQELQKCRY